ncbi:MULTISPECIES: hypothetical protein [Pseudofrankia]|uniref:hypothetical protein n=1 Tax=Pseudofrankia TaxID=2994363 RepID=UPI000234C5E0|nr:MULTISPECIES: hypothetical protein [Pseudofrankia]OHV35220.1 hypothetical protein BCD49_04435 [Pseudofrankia sp. EUN1h]
MIRRRVGTFLIRGLLVLLVALPGLGATTALAATSGCALVGEDCGDIVCEPCLVQTVVHLEEFIQPGDDPDELRVCDEECRPVYHWPTARSLPRTESPGLDQKSDPYTVSPSVFLGELGQARRFQLVRAGVVIRESRPAEIVVGTPEGKQHDCCSCPVLEVFLDRSGATTWRSHW